MITEEQLDAFRQSGEPVRIVRDGLAANDVYGIIVAWDDSSLVLRKINKRVVKLSRDYTLERAADDRSVPDILQGEEESK
ncbi:hypothetical protein DFQ01_13928 [Paenibacillus cellulosilyticus]|uniref:Uncharacterized protein n=1 Tax=Paenibacillus cellulosilyticus TaxID=375489 RepID=A0A2V2YNK7_9BACL|nr:hypothetical protein [Paenibacillus cellulosilyticus]PWV90978.1 hypothetical protein DFQ01_13928 [Paenibacillus cellulosilyticus]QKS45196.1 hypothetical protein HUB94_12795 [Paenibacillus cellulosilyticus]